MINWLLHFIYKAHGNSSLTIDEKLDYIMTEYHVPPECKTIIRKILELPIIPTVKMTRISSEDSFGNMHTIIFPYEVDNVDPDFLKHFSLLVYKLALTDKYFDSSDFSPLMPVRPQAPHTNAQKKAYEGLPKQYQCCQYYGDDSTIIFDSQLYNSSFSNLGTGTDISLSTGVLLA